MVEKLKQFADWERTWGPLTRWVVGLIFWLTVYALLHYADSHFVQRGEYDAYRAETAAALTQINSKLDGLSSSATNNGTRLDDIRQRLDRVEKLQDEGRGDLGAR